MSGSNVCCPPLALQGQHHGGTAEQADVVPVGGRLPQFGMVGEGIPGGPAVDGHVHGQLALSGLAGGFEDGGHGMDHAQRAALVHEGIAQLAPGLGDAEQPFQVHVSVSQAIHTAFGGGHGGEQLIDHRSGNDVAVLGGDQVDPWPAGADAGEAGAEHFPAGHVVMMKGPGVLDDVGRIAGLQHAVVGDETFEQVRRKEGVAERVIGHHRAREMEKRRELEFQPTSSFQG